MTQGRKPSVHAAAALVALALAVPATPRAQVPGPDRIEVLRADDGPRVLLAGVGVGTAFARAAGRLGGPGVPAAFFGAGPIVKSGALDGLPCGLLVMPDDTQRVRDVYLECTGERAPLERLSDRFRAALAALPALPSDPEHPDDVVFTEKNVVVTLSVTRAERDGARRRPSGPWELRVHVWDRGSASR